MSSRLIFVFIDIILPLMTGYFLHQRHIVSERTNNLFIKLNIIVVITLLSIASFWVLPLSIDLLLLPIYGILFTIIPCLLAVVTFARSFPNYLDRGAYIMSATLSNVGTIGGLCAFILYDELGYAYVNLIATPQNILLVILCFPMAQYYLDKHKANVARTKFQVNLKEMFLTWNQLPFVGMLVGITLNLQGIPRPQIIADIFQSLVHVGAWIALIPVGYLIQFGKAQEYYGKILSLLSLRYIIVPAIMYCLACSFFTDQVILATMLIVALTPSAINAVLCARLYQLTVDITTAAFLLTTPIFLLIIFPLLYIYLTNGGSL